MSEELVYKLIAIFGAGAGLLVAAGTNFLRHTRIGAIQAGLGAVAAAGGGLLTAVYIPWSFAIASASVAVVAFGILTFIKFSPITKVVSLARNTVSRPLGQFV